MSGEKEAVESAQSILAFLPAQKILSPKLAVLALISEARVAV